MHELSIVMSIIDIAVEESEKNNASEIEEIELEIGELSGVDMPAFDFAWEQVIKNTPLENVKKKVNRIEGEGECMECHTVFTMQNLYEACPVCDAHFIDIKKGKELRVKSLIVN